jgi:hypothetical protein
VRDTVIDTNVLVCANGKGPVGPADAAACSRWLLEVKRTGRVVIDTGQRILREYRNNLSASGQPGFGDEFFRWILSVAADTRHCVTTSITPEREASEDYVEFPKDDRLSAVDPADRKFIVVAAAVEPPAQIGEASDSKWWGWKEALEDHGLHVVFLCEEFVRRKYYEKMESRASD